MYSSYCETSRQICDVLFLVLVVVACKLANFSQSFSSERSERKYMHTTILRDRPQEKGTNPIASPFYLQILFPTLIPISIAEFGLKKSQCYTYQLFRSTSPKVTASKQNPIKTKRLERICKDVLKDDTVLFHCTKPCKQRGYGGNCLVFLPLHISVIPTCRKSAIRLFNQCSYSSQFGRTDHAH